MKQRRKESAIILENFQSIEDLVWSYSHNKRDQLFNYNSVSQTPWSFKECHGPIFDGRAEQSKLAVARPWIMGGKRDNPIFDDSSYSGTAETPPRQSGGRPWEQANHPYNIKFTDSLERELSEWNQEGSDLDAGNLFNWSRANEINIQDGDAGLFRRNANELDKSTFHLSKVNHDQLGINDDDELSSQVERDANQLKMDEWNRDDKNEDETWSYINHWRGINQRFMESEREPSIRSSNIGFGDSLHRELYRWANKGKVKGVQIFDVQQKEDSNKKQFLYGLRATSPYDGNVQCDSHNVDHSNHCGVMQDKVSGLHESRTNAIQRRSNHVATCGCHESAEETTHNSAPKVKHDSGFSSARSGSKSRQIINETIAAEQHQPRQWPEQIPQQKDEQYKEHEQLQSEQQEIHHVTNIHRSGVNAPLSKQSHNQEFKPKMSQKRTSLVDVQIERQKKSGTGDFYTRNQKLFENYKRNVRERGVPEVLYFHY